MFKAFIKDTPFGISILLFSMAVVFIALIAPVGGNKALIVRSGSMQPAIAVGDLVTVKPQQNYKNGDIVAFKDPLKSTVIVTHRIASQQIQDGKIFFRTKGDANEEADFTLVPKENVIGRADISIKGIGKLLAFTKTNTGFGAVVIFPAILVIVFEIINIFREIRKQKATGREVQNQPEYPIVNPLVETFNISKISNGNKFRLKLPSLRVFLPLALSTLLVYNTFAFLFDTETSTGNFFAASDSFGPPIAQTLVINEVLPDSSCFQGNTEAQWIEIYNGFDFTVNPKNYQITDGTNTIDLVAANNLSILPGGFLLLAHNSAIWNSCYSDNGTQTGNLGGQLNIDVGELHLIDTDGVTVLDVVRWNQLGDADPLQNQSIERVPIGLDSATGANFEPTDFIVREMPTPGYGSNLVLNEILSNTGLNFTTEWVEIYNPSNLLIDLTGWTLDEPNQLDKSLTSLGNISPSGFKVYDNPTTGWLNDGGETLLLKNPAGLIVDQRTFGPLNDDKSTGRNVDRGNTWIEPCAGVSKGTTNNGFCSP